MTNGIAQIDLMIGGEASPTPWPLQRPQLNLGLIYILGVPLLAGIATVRGVNIGGFNYAGFLWVIAFVIGSLLLIAELGLRPKNRVYFPLGPWFLWLAYMGLSFLWLDNPGFLHVQYALQLAMPVLVGILAGMFVRSRQQLDLLVKFYFYALGLLGVFVTLGLCGILSLDELDPVFVAARSVSLTAVVIAALFIAGTNRRLVPSWLGWAACLATAVVTGSRMASVAILVLPILNPVTRHPLRKALVTLVIGIIGVGVYLTPIFQERFFRGESGDLGQIASGDFDSAGRFESWPYVLDEALRRPWLGHGVGSVQVFIPQVWPDVLHPHNDYLRVAFEFGGLGVALFFGVLFWQLWSLKREVRRTTGIVQQVFGGAWLSLAVFLLIAYTDNPIIYHVWYMNPIFALIGAAYSVAREESLTAHASGHVAAVQI